MILILLLIIMIKIIIGTISFFYKISSEKGYDELHFDVNGAEMTESGFIMIMIIISIIIVFIITSR